MNLIIVHDEFTREIAQQLNAIISTMSECESLVLTEKDWNDNKVKISSENYVLFIGNVADGLALKSIIQWKYEKFNMKYGWIGKKALMIVEKYTFKKEEIEELKTLFESQGINNMGISISSGIFTENTIAKAVALLPDSTIALLSGLSLTLIGEELNPIALKKQIYKSEYTYMVKSLCSVRKMDFDSFLGIEVKRESESILMKNTFDTSFSDGYKFGTDNLVSISGSFSGKNYIDKINTAIKEAQEKLNDVVYGYNSTSGSAGGYIAEVWHAETYNIDAAVKGVNTNAWVPERVGGIKETFAQPDISLSNGNNYGLKYYDSGYNSAIQQAKSYWERYNHDFHGTDKTFEEFLTERGLDPDTTHKFTSIYNGQFRLIPKDQLNNCIEALNRKISQEAYRGSEAVEGYKETLQHLTDRLNGPNGVESIPLSKEDSKRLALLARDGDIDLNKIGINTENLVTYKYIFQQALNTGMTTAVVSMVLKVAPEIYKAIDKMIKDGQLELKDLENIGLATINGSALGFINGSISAAITTACMAGTFGTTLKSINPSIIGTLTVIVTNSIVYTIKLANKKISKEEFALKISKDIFIASCSIGLGTVTQSLVPELPAFAFLIGSFLGSLAGSFVYDKGYSKFMSFCCETGFTCFGLVEQNYKLPKSILKEMNIKSFDFRTFEPKSFEFKTFDFKSFEFKTFKYETIGLTFISREVIGVSKIGYVIHSDQ